MSPQKSTCLLTIKKTFVTNIQWSWAALSKNPANIGMGIQFQDTNWIFQSENGKRYVALIQSTKFKNDCSTCTFPLDY